MQELGYSTAQQDLARHFRVKERKDLSRDEAQREGLLHRLSEKRNAFQRHLTNAQSRIQVISPRTLNDDDWPLLYSEQKLGTLNARLRPGAKPN